MHFSTGTRTLVRASRDQNRLARSGGQKIDDMYQASVLHRLIKLVSSSYCSSKVGSHELRFDDVMTHHKLRKLELFYAIVLQHRQTALA